MASITGSYPSPSHIRSKVAALSVLSALVTHQLFRRYETFYFLVHAAFLLGPPSLITASVVPTLAHNTLLNNDVWSVYTSALCTHLTTLALSVIAYRLSPWHPLAAYPGPWWAKLSMFGPAIAFSGSRSKRVRELHERYGDVVRVGPNELSFRTIAAVPSIDGPSGIPKGTDWAGSMLRDYNLPLVALRDTEEHLRRRRPWNRGLGPAAIRTYHPVVAHRAQVLVLRLEEHLQAGGIEVDLGEWFNRFGYDFMSDMAFGGGSELLRNGDEGNVWGVIEKGMAMGFFLGHIPWLGVYIGHIPGAARPLHALFSHSERLAGLRLRRGSTSPDLFHYLNNEDLPDTPPPPPRQLYDDGVLAIVAGSDTTSSALTSVFHCLLTHPQAFSRLREEVARFYPEGDDPFSAKHHKDMHYLQAVINEALRLFPPVASGSTRRVPDNAAPVHIFGSVYAPPGTVVRLPTWTIQRYARNFSFPDTFWPERWLVAAGLVSLADVPLPSGVSPPQAPTPDKTSTDAGAGWFAHDERAFLAFSHGPMNCPGKALAMLEMRVLVIALVQRFGARMRLREGWDAGYYEREIRDYFSASRPCVPVVLG